jgi:hypothetical protein
VDPVRLERVTDLLTTEEHGESKNLLFICFFCTEANRQGREGMGVV